MENNLVKNHKRNSGYSDVLLSYSTFVRHSLIIHKNLTDSKAEDETWKECMFRKLEELEIFFLILSILMYAVEKIREKGVTKNLIKTIVLLGLVVISLIV